MKVHFLITLLDKNHLWDSLSFVKERTLSIYA